MQDLKLIAKSSYNCLAYKMAAQALKQALTVRQTRRLPNVSTGTAGSFIIWPTRVNYSYGGCGERLDRLIGLSLRKRGTTLSSSSEF